MHPIHRVTRFSVVGPYTLSVTFADGTVQHIDFAPVLHGVLFGPLREPSMFNAVSLDEEAGTSCGRTGQTSIQLLFTIGRR
jgi:hypothetical protein